MFHAVEQWDEAKVIATPDIAEHINRVFWANYIIPSAHNLSCHFVCVTERAARGTTCSASADSFVAEV